MVEFFDIRQQGIVGSTSREELIPQFLIRLMGGICLRNLVDSPSPTFDIHEILNYKTKLLILFRQLRAINERGKQFKMNLTVAINFAATLNLDIRLPCLLVWLLHVFKNSSSVIPSSVREIVSLYHHVIVRFPLFYLIFLSNTTRQTRNNLQQSNVVSRQLFQQKHR